MDFQTTLNQIGNGNLMAVGAREFTRDGQVLQFRVGSKRNEKSVIRVALDPSDTYTVERVTMNTRTYAFERDTVEGVYADNIGGIVRRMGDR